MLEFSEMPTDSAINVYDSSVIARPLTLTAIIRLPTSAICLCVGQPLNRVCRLMYARRARSPVASIVITRITYYV